MAPLNVKRSKTINLILLGGLGAGALGGCNEKAVVSPKCVYTNNDYIPGVGYYHAPFRAWFPYPYNHFDPQSHRYFFGGQWSATPMLNITNLSTPTPQTALLAESMRTDISRGGFGASAGHYSSYGS